MFKLTIFLFCVSAAVAYDASPAIVSQDQNIIRSYGNLGQVSTFSKTLDTPFSSVRKSDVRISNPGLIASPYAHTGYPSVVAPAYAHPGYAHPGYAHPGYAHPGYAHPGYVAPAAYPHGPIVAPVAKAIVPGAGLLGVAYSAAPSVSHMTFSNGLGLNYAW